MFALLYCRYPQYSKVMMVIDRDTAHYPSKSSIRKSSTIPTSTYMVNASQLNQASSPLSSSSYNASLPTSVFRTKFPSNDMKTGSRSLKIFNATRFESSPLQGKVRRHRGFRGTYALHSPQTLNISPYKSDNRRSQLSSQSSSISSDQTKSIEAAVMVSSAYSADPSTSELDQMASNAPPEHAMLTSEDGTELAAKTLLSWRSAAENRRNSSPLGAIKTAGGEGKEGEGEGEGEGNILLPLQPLDLKRGDDGSVGELSVDENEDEEWMSKMSSTSLREEIAADVPVVHERVYTTFSRMV